MEDKPPIGFNYIRLSLADVLLDPKTGKIYTPNTDKMALMGADSVLTNDGEGDTIESRGNPYHDPRNGRFTSGENPVSGVDKSAKGDIIKLGEDQYHDPRNGRFTSGKNGGGSLETSLKSSEVASSIIIGQSLSAAAKNYPVKLIDSKQHVKLAENQKIEGIAFAGKGTGTVLRDRFRLESTYHIPAEEWQKVSGKGKIVKDGKEVLAELHWYEARGEIYEMKAKRYYDEN